MVMLTAEVHYRHAVKMPSRLRKGRRSRWVCRNPHIGSYALFFREQKCSGADLIFVMPKVACLRSEFTQFTGGWGHKRLYAATIKRQTPRKKARVHHKSHCINGPGPENLPYPLGNGGSTPKAKCPGSS